MNGCDKKPYFYAWICMFSKDYSLQPYDESSYNSQMKKRLIKSKKSS